MALRDSRVAWIVGGVVALGALIGGIAYASTPPSKPQSPSGPQYLAVITDPNMVRQYQSIIAQVLADKGQPGLPMPPFGTWTVGDYNGSDVDGNPANARWVRFLSAFQKYSNTQAPFTAAPPGYPAQLRTDGVLDYATAVMIMNA